MSKSSMRDAATLMIDIAAGLQEAPEKADERRDNTRYPYHRKIAMVLLSPTGHQSKPVIVQSRDVSMGGLRVVSNALLHVGSQGAVQLRRSDGKLAVVGIEVVYCEYVGNMNHHTGLKFIKMPNAVSLHDFVDDEGNLLEFR